MISLLENIVEIFLNIPAYIIYAVESIINLFFSAVEGVWIAATSLIPLPEVPKPPEFISNINWFFPIGALIAVITPVLVGYIAFLAIRWIYKWAGEL